MRQPAGARTDLPWEKWENELIEREFPTGSINAIARRLQRSAKAVEHQARNRLGLTRDKELIRKQRSAAGEAGRAKQAARPRPPRKAELCYGHGVTGLEKAWRGEAIT